MSKVKGSKPTEIFKLALIRLLTRRIHKPEMKNFLRHTVSLAFVEDLQILTQRKETMFDSINLLLPHSNCKESLTLHSEMSVRWQSQKIEIYIKRFIFVNFLLVVANTHFLSLSKLLREY